MGRIGIGLATDQLRSLMLGGNADSGAATPVPVHGQAGWAEQGARRWNARPCSEEAGGVVAQQTFTFSWAGLAACEGCWRTMPDSVLFCNPLPKQIH